MILGLNKESLEDLSRANDMQPGDRFTLRYVLQRVIEMGWDGHIVTWCQYTVKTRFGDSEGALADSDKIIEKQCRACDLQESGVLKRMMKDLPGALSDLNRSLELSPNDYEVLKHRAAVRFLMNNANGAHSDAQMALTLKPNRVDAGSYGLRYFP